MYKFIQNISLSQLEVYQKLLDHAKWSIVESPDRRFYTYMMDDFPHAKRAFFLKIPPGGQVHRHTDTARPYKTFHVPIQTNSDCWNATYNPDTHNHLEVGKVYEINRQIEHASFNMGTTDRIHLLIEATELVI